MLEKVWQLDPAHFSRHSLVPSGGVGMPMGVSRMASAIAMVEKNCSICVDGVRALQHNARSE